MRIRSQDKKVLIDTDALVAENSCVNAILGQGSHSVELGHYHTDERAIEVLDEIQKHLVSGSSYDTLCDHRRDIHEKVFNMPQK